MFLRFSAWRALGKHLAESLTHRARVMVQGRLKQRSFDTKNGESRTELELDEVGRHRSRPLRSSPSTVGVPRQRFRRPVGVHVGIVGSYTPKAIVVVSQTRSGAHSPTVTADPPQ